MDDGMPTPLELALRILLAGALGAVIGFERDHQLRPAGLRTHSLVAMASAAFMVISTVFALHQGYVDHEVVRVDASRIASEVVSGAGFIAGGAILRSGPTVQGLTTAAGLWLVTAIGLAAGSGMWLLAVSITALGMLALWGLRFVGGTDLRERGKVSLLLDREVSFAALRTLIEGAHTRVVTHEYRRTFAVEARGTAREQGVGAREQTAEAREPNREGTEVTFFVTHGEKFDPDALLLALREQPGLIDVHVEKLA
jgi:putative Mg2+ transporter-C (MgtC) family protein